MACVLAVAGLVAAPADAFIPKAERVALAATEANQAAQRTQALWLEVRLRIGAGEPVATGELVTHPTGLARLELRGANRLVERHLLRGSERLASRNGRLVDQPRAFLPPLFMLQADSALTLRAAMRAYGVRVDAVALAPCGQRDCYVIGDAERAPPRALPEAEFDQDEAEFGQKPPANEQAKTDADGVIEQPVSELRWVFPEPAEAAHLPEGADAVKVWFDIERFEVVRMDFGQRVQVRFGPTASFGGVRFPAWIAVTETDRRPVRLEIVRAAPVSAAPAAAFGIGWLLETPREEPEPQSRHVIERPSSPLPGSGGINRSTMSPPTP